MRTALKAQPFLQKGTHTEGGDQVTDFETSLICVEKRKSLFRNVVSTVDPVRG